jgi:Putative Flp pilus-assembly TadE/G-like/von Willebrand factor type A domain
MRFSSARRSRKSGSVMVLFTLMLPTLLLPLAGLAVDASIARLMQIRLQAAVDGAALGAGRLLGTGAVTETVAGEFLAANFRTDGSAGTWNVSNLQSNIVYTPGITKRIDISATATVPLLFLRIFGVRSASIAANGSATRSDSRVVFVIDRSGSMNTDDGSGKSTVIQDAINETTILVKRFIEGTDELGLVVFDGSAVVGYPTYAAGTWTPTIGNTGGPNKTFYDGTANDMVNQIAAIKADSGTGMAEGLTLAYIELQKAHMRDLADPVNNGVDGRLNSIVLLTDGLPTGISLYLNDPNNLGVNNIIKATSTCSNKTITVGTQTAATMMKSFFAIGGYAPYTGTSTWGMYPLASADTTQTSNWWLGNNGVSPYRAQDASNAMAIPTNSGPYNNCASGMVNGSSIYSYLTKIPAADMWGNAMTGTGYTHSHITGNPGATTVYTSGTPGTSASSDYDWGLAMWNSVDNAAKSIRTDANLPNRTGDTGGNMGIQIYVIGYSGNLGGCDDGLLKRVANDITAAGYDSTQPRGKYYTASDGASLDAAYNQLASDLLRLAR